MERYFWPKPIYIDGNLAFESHGAAILLLVRNGIARDWRTLCRAFNFNPQEDHSGHYSLRQCVRELMSAGLLEGKSVLGPYRVSDNWENIQNALGVSLVEAANLVGHSGIAVTPVFGSRPELYGSSHVFVIMPFDSALDVVYGQVKKTCDQLRLRVERADDIFSASRVMEDIWNSICNSGIIVADCTGRNANVFYEIGIAHTVGKKVILLAQSTSDVPSDITHFRYIKYDKSSAGLRILGKKLKKTLDEAGRGIWKKQRIE